MNIQWFPGHMAKTRRILAENLKMVDVVVELLDARIPASSKNPEIDGIVKNKPKIVVLNKADLADEKISNEWSKWYNSQGYATIFIDSIKGTGIKQLKDQMRDIMKDRIERDRQRGRIFRPIRTMIVGIPNVGKSSLINKIAGKKSAVTGDRPGVTRNKQWINVNNEIQLMDTPGILWPKFEDKTVGINLAVTGAIKDEIIDTVELASILLEHLSKTYPENIKKRYKLESLQDKKGYELLEEAGKKRGCIISGGEVDLTRIAAIVLDEFRGGKIGRITLERPGDAVQELVAD
ncbi:MAG TPA: ribosome biogenesis GTPase YlqF [Hungateiclostridium thermocellum]|jgi:ribosome biogenesis GTPase A|uniref:Ribosome biogenesis GTPase A n=2 Tax=Acetivibrio thermocellus TaxID=1515 RepID=A3DDG9_ACET2|nr:ribosome biogenesis GTPase YlqF [Acetivibrio thermocellus]NLG89968.1 ribosome biogenesis GTPase YlqF [Clostridiaceae bacterium]CDG35458.1 Ribosome biogenesis GTPase A [Acetivibrio thermocellus BC1]ABN51998.1 ribosome biogenesis GTP-binding protein YlqF [Acetivibrio thermocellus ATCC 27405]ADU74521.1 ribosome biogenesis GTP-binding protein YlqF [Acetivibrio thermocellus DSM 1313]ALX08464.1 ribosome biogenesis GTP-binding protein YlqF [Acetivibrio thermocellus AD2]